MLGVTFSIGGIGGTPRLRQRLLTQVFCTIFFPWYQKYKVDSECALA